MPASKPQRPRCLICGGVSLLPSSHGTHFSHREKKKPQQQESTPPSQLLQASSSRPPTNLPCHFPEPPCTSLVYPPTQCAECRPSYHTSSLNPYIPPRLLFPIPHTNPYPSTRLSLSPCLPPPSPLTPPTISSLPYLTLPSFSALHCTALH